MYRTCCVPGLHASGSSTAGSITSRSGNTLGPTDLDNLVPICERHHHLVHEGGWTLQLHAGRRITLHRPDGTISFDGVTTNRIRPATSCQRNRPPPTTATEVAEELQLALHHITANAP